MFVLLAYVADSVSMHRLRKPTSVPRGTTRPLALGFLVLDAYGDFCVNRLVPYWYMDRHVVMPPSCLF